MLCNRKFLVKMLDKHGPETVIGDGMVGLDVATRVVMAFLLILLIFDPMKMMTNDHE